MTLETEIIYLDSKIYSVTSILASAYDLQDKINIKIKRNDKDAQNEVKMTLKDKKYIATDIVGEFMDKLNEHQLLEQLEAKYKTIREIIFAQAFSPCEKLQEIIDNGTRDTRI